MKKYLCLFFTMIFSLSFTVFAEDNFEKTVAIQPRSSYVFDSVSSFIDPAGYGGSSILSDYGSGTITITLQKYSSTSKKWTSPDGSYSKTFSGTSIPGYSKTKALSKGKWRCKTYVKATVGKYTDSRTVYSGTLTIK